MVRLADLTNVMPDRFLKKMAIIKEIAWFVKSIRGLTKIIKTVKIIVQPCKMLLIMELANNALRTREHK